MKVAFTGTRLGMTQQQRTALLRGLKQIGATELHHGDCQGADFEAHQIARQLGLRVVGHPPVADGLRSWCECDDLRLPQEYLVRNRSMVLDTELLVAAPDGPQRLRSGTWATVRHAQKGGLPYVVIERAGIATPDWVKWAA